MIRSLLAPRHTPLMSTSHYQSPDFATLERALSDSGAGIGASEAHGIICGVLCVPGSDQVGWVSEIMDGADSKVDPEECAGLLVAILEAAREQLGSDSFEFEPMLPDDGVSLNRRSEALGEWCTGFLFGLTQAMAGSTEALAEDSLEVMGDLTKFASIRAADEEDEEEETAFAELVEYIRVGVMLISEELYSAQHRSTLH